MGLSLVMIEGSLKSPQGKRFKLDYWLKDLGRIGRKLLSRCWDVSRFVLTWWSTISHFLPKTIFRYARFSRIYPANSVAESKFCTYLRGLQTGLTIFTIILCPHHIPILDLIRQLPAHRLLWHLAGAVHHHHLAQHNRPSQQKEESLGHLNIVLSQIFEINTRLARWSNMIAAYHCSSSVPKFVIHHHPQEGGIRSVRL